MSFLVLLAVAGGCGSRSRPLDGSVVAGQSGQAGVTTAAQSALGGSQTISSSVTGRGGDTTTPSGGVGGAQSSGAGGTTTASGGASISASGGTSVATTGGTNSAASGGSTGGSVAFGGTGGGLSLATGGTTTGGTVGFGGTASGGTARGGSGGMGGAASGGTTHGGSGGMAGSGPGGTAAGGSVGTGGSHIIVPGDGGAGLSDYCIGDSNKLSYLGQDSSPAATNFPSGIAMDCCGGLGVNLHTLAQLGFDLDLDITYQAVSIPPGQYAIGSGVGPFRSVSLRHYGPISATSPTFPMSGAVTSGGPNGVTAWDMGLCLEADSASSPSAGIRLYVPHVTMIPYYSLHSRFQIFRLADQSITPTQAQAQSLDSLVLAATPLLDLWPIYYVEQSTGNIGTPSAATIASTLSGASVPLSGSPFVVKVDDVPIYLGTLFLRVSSMIPVGPVIVVDTITNDIVPISAPKTGSNDPRFDPRIVQVLTETGKLVP
jgi:hypothetical protein